MSASLRSARNVRAGSRPKSYLLMCLTVVATTSIMFGMLPTEIQYRIFPSYVGEERFMEAMYADRYEWVGSENELAARADERERERIRYVSAAR